MSFLWSRVVNNCIFSGQGHSSPGRGNRPLNPNKCIVMSAVFGCGVDPRLVPEYPYDTLAFIPFTQVHPFHSSPWAAVEALGGSNANWLLFLFLIPPNKKKTKPNFARHERGFPKSYDHEN